MAARPDLGSLPLKTKYFCACVGEVFWVKVWFLIVFIVIYVDDQEFMEGFNGLVCIVVTVE